MTNIVISGGSYPSNWKTIQNKHDENFIRFDTAELLVLNWQTKEIIQTLRHVSEPEALNPSLMFKGCEVDEDSIRVVTNTEIVEYNKKTFAVSNVITNKTFNDLHAVKKVGDQYYVVNTGLEIIQLVDEQGNLINEFNMASDHTWNRFDKDLDYRKIGSTKPHENHINHIFGNDGDLYVTRMLKKDAVDLSQNTIFDVEVGNPHDGIEYNGKVYFTTTNGHVVVFDGKTKKRLDVYDINKILEDSNYKAGGWCRGILPLSDDRILLGYTELRNSKFKEFISMTINLGDKPAKTRVLEIDLSNRKAVDEYTYPSSGDKGSAIFSILEL